MRTPEQLAEALTILGTSIKTELVDQVFEGEVDLLRRVSLISATLIWVFGAKSPIVEGTLLEIQDRLGKLAKQEQMRGGTNGNYQ